MLRFIGGLFLTFTVIAPVADMDFDIMFDVPLDYVQQANDIAADGQQITLSQQREIIKQQCEAYILDKAFAYQLQPEIEVTLSDDDLPIPTHVRLSGTASPYAKKVLQEWIEDEMGISKENQLWIG